MTPAEAAAIYLDYQPIADVITGPLDRAKKVLREHLEGRPSYKGITAQRGGSDRFSQAEAKKLLGPKKVEQCTVFVPSTTLVLPARLRKGAVELRYELVPAGTAAAVEETAAP
jgi:hypothetical protein